MKLTDHLLASPALIALYPITTAPNIIIAMSASVLIDLDHVHLIMRERAYTREGIKRLNENIYKPTIDGKPNRMYVDIVYLFHTIEFNLLLLLLSRYYPFLKYVVIGFIFHILCDIYHHRAHHLPIIRWLFLADWLRYTLSTRHPHAKS